MTRTTLSGLLLTTVLSSATTAWAQSATDSLLLDAIRIEAAEAQELLGNEEISDEEIEARNPTSAKDIFAGKSAVTASGGASIAQRVYVNGIEETLLNVTIDGARQNKSPFHHAGNVLLDPFLLKRVEVSKGLAPADVGAGALGGSIAYETKDASDLLDAGDTFGGVSRLTVGSNGQGTEGALAIFGRSGRFEYLLSASKRDGDDYEDGDGNEVHNSASALSDYLGKVAYETENGHRFEFSAGRTTDDGLRASQGGVVRANFASVIGRPSELVRSTATRESYTFSYENMSKDKIWAPEFLLSYNEQDNDAVAIYGRNTSLSGAFKNEFNLSNGTLTAGIDFFRESASGGTGGDIPGNRREEHEGIGLFAQARQDFGARFSTSYGARFDVQEFRGVDGEKIDDNGVSINGSVDYLISDTLSLNAGLATTWGGFELGESSLISDTGTTYEGFKASRSRAARLGLRYDNGAFQVSGALFRTEIDDVSPGTGARGVTSDLVSQGFDSSLTYNFASGYISANYTYSDVTENDEEIGTFAYYRGAPGGHRLALSGYVDVNDVLGVGGVAQIVPSESRDSGIELEGYTTVDVYASYTPRNLDNLELRLDVRNLFDETFAARSTDGLDSTRAIAINEAGRTIALTARLKF